ncbi:hypothetical protein TSAR_001762 [Trichomalopsis sarcophagae]|uniref:Uncharacterized protein n=1 Tax=Trichomalopsis sarcophagae TaxID=543379 RepID=A0A232EK48_9HYME|nr:hypothetical protein TSAR_001762 [Trichomalopsis sarcophagae]
MDSPLKNIVENHIRAQSDEFNNNTPLTTFNNENKATDPKTKEQDSVLFTNTREVKNLLKYMSNKTSTSWDGIPNT